MGGPAYVALLRCYGRQPSKPLAWMMSVFCITANPLLVVVARVLPLSALAIVRLLPVV